MSKPVQKPQVGHEAAAPKREEKPVKGHSAPEGRCGAVSCKSPEKKFGFCDEHFEHFKFGLIKKTGQQVSDYEKKFEHYQAYKQRQVAARKAA